LRVFGTWCEATRFQNLVDAFLRDGFVKVVSDLASCPYAPESVHKNHTASIFSANPSL